MTDARNPRWGDAAHTSILLEIFDGGQWVPFTARGDDVEPSGRALFQKASAGDYGFVEPYKTPADPPAKQLRYVDKMIMIGRLTDDEGDMLMASFNQAPGKLQLMYGAATIIDTQNPNFEVLHDFIASVLGSSDRADEILAPTE